MITKSDNACKSGQRGLPYKLETTKPPPETFRMTENLFEESLLLSGLHCSLYRQQQGLLDIGKGKMRGALPAKILHAHTVVRVARWL